MSTDSPAPSPGAPLRVLVAGRTDVGLVREHNEDSYVVIDLAARERPDVETMKDLAVGTTGVLLLVCDGMGGAAAGEVASSMAVDAIFHHLTAPPPSAEAETAAPAEQRDDAEPHGPESPKLMPVGPGSEQGAVPDFARRLRSATFNANHLIHVESRSDHARAGMGTTMTGVGVIDGWLVMAQVGDSRAYVLREGTIKQVTRDQSLVNQLLESGQITEEQARLFEHSNVILQALGVQPDVDVHLSRVQLRAGDRVVVCSDGLTGVVSDEELAAVLGGSEDCAESCRLLIELARSGGGPDNITAVVARIEGGDLPPPTPDDAIHYARWRLDEPPPPPPTQEVPETREREVEPPPRRPSVDGAQLFLSSMLLSALALLSTVGSFHCARTEPAVECLIEARAGYAIHIDGRDVGARTRAAGTALRLPPGRHRVSVRGRGAPRIERTVEVPTAAQAAPDTPICSARFDPEGP